MNSSLPQTPGIYPLHNKATGQRFTLLIPETVAHHPVPLMVVLHWGGQVTPYLGRSILMGLVYPALGELDAILVAPDCMRSSWDQPDSEKDVLALLSLLNEHYHLASGKTVLLGYSMGAQGVWYLTARHQEDLAGGIALSGPAPAGFMTTTWKIPLYVIHSRQDEYFAYEDTARAVNRLRANGAPIEFITINGATHFDTAGFIEPLRHAKPWLVKLWAGDVKQ